MVKDIRTSALFSPKGEKYSENDEKLSEKCFRLSDPVARCLYLSPAVTSEMFRCVSIEAREKAKADSDLMEARLKVRQEIGQNFFQIRDFARGREEGG